MNAGEVADPLGAAPRLAALRAAIATRARDCERDPAAVTLVAVSKTYAADQVWPTIAIGGQTIFGENRVQEAKGKWPELRARAAELGKTIELHLIGPLQSNKAAEAVELFDVIETVDRDKIAQALAAAMAKAGKRPRLFVEVNTGAEPQKAGIAPRDADAFRRPLPRRPRADDRGTDVRAAGRRARLAAFCIAQGHRRAQRDQAIVDGHERRLAARRAARRDGSAGRQRDFRRANVTRAILDASAAPMRFHQPAMRAPREASGGLGVKA